ncbi:hypothetical protein fh0823_21960 [Francisella halioticida]|uniref:hypothetical protein n=1 Tax=Francisella halioticida TaxID=549298 RepID=UPI001AFBEC87|nr:hypothetical protein [Francisella halioticida]BCD92057.1 hypothetical protein fh0823_21960 [Francisella halioticida]
MAKVVQILKNVLDKVEVYVSGNITKNVKSITVLGSNGMVGIQVAINNDYIVMSFLGSFSLLN